MAKVNPDQMTMGASMVGDIYSQMAQELFLRMIQRIKQRGVADLQDNPYLWQLEKLNNMHFLNEENIQYVIEQTGIARELMDEIIQNEGLKVYQNTSEQLAAQLNKKTPQYNSVQDTLARYANQTFLDIDNLVNQTLITTNLGQNSAMRVYQEIIEQSVAEVTTGLKTADKAISDTVMKWIDKGIPSAFVDKGGNTWTIERYARTVMESTTYRVYNEMRTGAAEELGVTTFHMSSHAAARPACASIQGHIVTKAQHSFDSGDTKVGRVYSLWEHGYGEASGTMGINCHHVLTPFVIGVNEMPYEDIPDPKQAIANGEKQAKQRAYERGIRDAKYKVAAAKALGDEGLRKRYQALLDSRRAGIRNLIDDNDFLHRDYSREKTYQNAKYIRAYSDVLTMKRRDEYDRFVMGMGDKKTTFEQWMTAQANSEAKDQLKSQRFVAKKITSGEWGTVINPEKQSSHMKATVKDGGSYFDDDVDVQDLFDRYAGTGKVERGLSGAYKNAEIIKDINVKGYVVTQNGDIVKATGIKIHHSKNRTHIVPFARKG